MSLYHDASAAPLLDLRRRFKAVVDLLSAMIFGVVVLVWPGRLSLLYSGMGSCGLGPFILLFC